MEEIRMNPLYERDLSLFASKINWSKLRNKTLLISGATGMIGVFLIDLIMYHNSISEDNIHIIVMSRDLDRVKERLGRYLDKKEFEYIIQDVTNSMVETLNKCFEEDMEQIEEKIKLNEPMYKRGKRNIDFIIHGASNTHPILYASNPIGTIDANVIGTKNLLELATTMKDCRFVYLSSVEIYGENRGDVDFFKEDYLGYIDCNSLRACYSEGKRLGETLCHSYMVEHKLDMVIPRLSRVYGPTMLSSDSKAISQIMKNAIMNQDIILKSEGNQMYSYLYVGDVVTAIFTIMLEGNRGNCYNVADNNSYMTLKDLAEYMASLSKTKVRYEIPDDNERRGYSTASKALLDDRKLKELSWSNSYSMQQGLETTYILLKNSSYIKRRDEI